MNASFREIGITVAVSLLLSSICSNPALAQKDSRGWDGTSSAMYNTSSSYGSSSGSSLGSALGSSLGSVFGSYGGPSHGLFTPFGRLSPRSSGYQNQQSSNAPSSGGYYDSMGNPTTSSNSGYHPGSNTGVNTPYGNPNPQFTPPANLSFAEQQVRNKQREQELAQSRASQPINPSILQAQRWETEWRQAHPGQAVPNAGQLQKMHSGEIQNEINSGWAQARQRWAAKSNEEYQLATKISQRNAAQEGRTWNKAEFDREYDESHREHAAKYLQSVQQSREITERGYEMDRLREIGGR